jgi:hypothetical protein
MKANPEPSGSPVPPASGQGAARAEFSPEHHAEFERFMIDFDGIFPPPLRPLFRAYVRTLLSTGPRKSIRRMAVESGVSGSTLRKMIQDSRWDDRRLRDHFRGQVLREHPMENGCALILETKWQEIPKTAAPTPGPGAPPPESTSPVIVHLGLAEGRFRCFLESEPYLPQDWLADGARREWRGIPKKHVFRPTWQIALTLLGQARSQGLRVGWLYVGRKLGGELPFLLALGDLNYRYVAEVTPDLSGWLHPPLGLPSEDSAVVVREPSSAPGRMPQRPPHTVRELSMGCPASERFAARDPYLPEKVEPWVAGIIPFYPADRGLPSGALGLIVLRHETSGETRYFLTNGALGTSLADLVKIALAGKPIEQQLKEDAKATGLHQVWQRGYRMLQRHLILSAISLLFRSKMLREEAPEKEESSPEIMSTG